MFRWTFAALPHAFTVILTTAATARTIDADTVYSETCPEAAFYCGEELTLVDGETPPTTVDFVEPARLEIDYGTPFRVLGSSILNVSGGIIRAHSDVGDPVVHASGQSRLTVAGGEVIGEGGAVVAVDESVVAVSGGLLDGDVDGGGTISLRDNARGTISGGDVVRRDGYGAFASGNSELTITGGRNFNFGMSVSAIGTRDNATVHIFGGTFEGGFSFRDQSVVNVFAGTFMARPGNTELGYLGDSASANIHGGVFSSVENDRRFEIHAVDNSTVTFFGSGFETAELYPGAFQLTGFLSDGTPLEVLAAGNFVLREIPEPSSIWLAAKAYLSLSFARKHETVMQETFLHNRLTQAGTLIQHITEKPPASAGRERPFVT